MSDQTQRQPLMSVVVGHRGVGKTFQTRKVLIMDVNDDYGFQGLPDDLPDDRFSKGGIEEKSAIFNRDQERIAIEAAPVIKSVFCSYRGILIVYDVHGNKVHELSGQITYEKYKEIESRSREGITEYEGLDDYKCYACELKEKEHEAAWDNQFDPLDKPIKGTGNTYSGSIQQQIQTSASAPSQPVVGDIYFDTVKNCYSAWTGTEWIDIKTAIGQVLAGQNHMNAINSLNQKPRTPDPMTDENDPLTKILNNMNRRKPNL